jgi:hypothetical protein
MKFASNIIEQMDMAFDFISMPDSTNHRLAIILIDNCIELLLHRHAESLNKQREYTKLEENSKYSERDIKKATGRYFPPKVMFAHKSELINDDEKLSINLIHNFFRNQLYHQGLKYNRILCDVAKYYYQICTGILCKFSSPYTEIDNSPIRARKYLGTTGDFSSACLKLHEMGSIFYNHLPNALFGDLKEFIYHYNSLFEYMWCHHTPEHISKRTMRLRYCQYWEQEDSQKFDDFLKENKRESLDGEDREIFLLENYEWDIKDDPIPEWKDIQHQILYEKNPAKALKLYVNLMQSTEAVREMIDNQAEFQFMEADYYPCADDY